MRSNGGAGAAVEQVTAGLDSLAAADVIALDDQELRDELLDLVTVTHRVHAELVRRVGVFDRRGLAEPDGFKAAKGWLQAFGRVSGQLSHRLVKTARMLRQLPQLGAAAQSGQVSGEHLQQVARLVDQLGVERVGEVEATLADAAAQLDVPRFGVVCDRVRAHLDPDGVDPAMDFEKRTLALSPVGGMVGLRGQLDPEGGAALATALDALMTPPGEGDTRNAGQRRADALVELARRQLTAGTLPTVGGQRPQVGVLLMPQALSPTALEALARAQRDATASQRLREFVANPPEPAERADPVADLFGRTGADMRRDLYPSEPERPAQGDTAAGGAAAVPEAASAVSQPAWSQAGWADPPYLNWVGPIPPEVAQRIACDADIWRIILDPATGMPLDVGRAHRLVPHWIRRALHARDRGCR